MVSTRAESARMEYGTGGGISRFGETVRRPNRKVYTTCCKTQTSSRHTCHTYAHTRDWKTIPSFFRDARGCPVLVATSPVLVGFTKPPAGVESLPSTYLRIEVHHGREGRDHAISSGHKVSGAELGQAAQKERQQRSDLLLNDVRRDNQKQTPVAHRGK